MAGWYVSESDSDEKETSDLSQDLKPDCVVSFTLDKVIGDSTVLPSKVIELLQAISFNKTLELECTNGYHEERNHKRKKRKRKRKVTNVVYGEVSETTSEIVSTHTTSTGECRDTRRPSLSTFDYEHEDFPALKGVSLLTRKRPHQGRGDNSHHSSSSSSQVFASIEAQMKNEESQQSPNIINEDNSPLVGNKPVTHCNNDGRETTHSNGCHSGIYSKVFNFSFDEDDDYDSITSEPELAIFSKIKHIEEFLEQND